MKPTRDHLLAAGGAVVIVGLALAIVFLVLDVQRRGQSALERERTQQVQSLAHNQDASLSSSHAAMQTFANQSPLNLTVNDEDDRAVLDATQKVFGELLESGFILIDKDGIVVNGTLLPEGAIGTTLERAGLVEAIASGEPGTLPVSEGLTVPGPVLTSYGPILDDAGQTVGLMAFESIVEPSSSFNEEVSRFRAGTTGYFAFVDELGTVVASSNPDQLGRAFEDPDLLARDSGTYRIDGRIYVIQDLPSHGWKALSSQNIDEFEEGLGRQVGRALAVLGGAALLAGGAAFILMLHRLRAARREQERLAEINATREEFISIVSHELRTPVAGVLGFLQSTLDHWGSMDEDARLLAIERAAANARRLHALTRDVIDTTAIESGKISYLFEPLDLGVEIESGVLAARDSQPGRAVELIREDDELVVRADADRIQQVLANLLDNAFKNSPADVAVTVTLRRENDEAILEVRDGGAGLVEGESDSLFDKFVRGRGSTVEGTGLGLFISREIVAAHGGTISAGNHPDGGAVFTITMPLAPAASMAGRESATLVRDGSPRR